MPVFSVEKHVEDCLYLVQRDTGVPVESSGAAVIRVIVWQAVVG